MQVKACFYFVIVQKSYLKLPTNFLVTRVKISLEPYNTQQNLYYCFFKNHVHYTKFSPSSKGNV